MDQHERLKDARIAAGYKTGTDAAQAMKISVATYNAHENGHRGLTLKAAERYADFFNVRESWLLVGDEPRQWPEDKEQAFRDWQRDLAETTHGVFVPGHRYHGATQGVFPEIDVSAGAGDGQIGESNEITLPDGTTGIGHQVVAEWMLPESFFRHELRAQRDGIILMSVTGDSMLPTLQPGDRVIVDTTNPAFRSDGIYVFDDGDGEPRVKRLSKVVGSKPARLMVISDNEAVKPQDIPAAEIRILGRAVGRIGRL
ncbi:LexA family transcriptional regulator [Pelagibacterium luteolum]|uniref:Helix-turn-helix domain-containing protein n=1 Tax=Pelagibacterium luteolum TaxID=440168 RepID=A0A1G7ZH43_9HYPH|nr:S24 family peptidase [Pelagibacterium luteolum]SDH08072.1 Helix-turn-helix domain-containing protein [Pelagibacterium luteolum]